MTVLPLTIETHRLGMQVAERYMLSVYYGLIIASALQAGCDVLWSEDMQHDMLVEEQLRVRNPFL